jgi:hypothetical protein
MACASEVLSAGSKRFVPTLIGFLIASFVTCREEQLFHLAGFQIEGHEQENMTKSPKDPGVTLAIPVLCAEASVPKQRQLAILCAWATVHRIQVGTALSVDRHLAVDPKLVPLGIVSPPNPNAEFVSTQLASDTRESIEESLTRALRKQVKIRGVCFDDVALVDMIEFLISRMGNAAPCKTCDAS